MAQYGYMPYPHIKALEELSKLSITNDLNINTIKEYIRTYDELIYVIKDISDAKLILIGYYENKYLTVWKKRYVQGKKVTFDQIKKYTIKKLKS